MEKEKINGSKWWSEKMKERVKKCVKVEKEKNELVCKCIGGRDV